jgi:hypothetical protein
MPTGGSQRLGGCGRDQARVFLRLALSTAGISFFPHADVQQRELARLFHDGDVNFMIGRGRMIGYTRYMVRELHTSLLGSFRGAGWRGVCLCMVTGNGRAAYMQWAKQALCSLRGSLFPWVSQYQGHGLL